MNSIVSIQNYIESLYLPYYFIDLDENNEIVFSINKDEIPGNDTFSSEEIYTYVLEHSNKVKKLAYKQLFIKILEPMYFTLDELVSIQLSSDPFTNEEIEDILDTELDKKNYQEINFDVVDFCLLYLRIFDSDIKQAV